MDRVVAIGGRLNRNVAAAQDDRETPGASRGANSVVWTFTLVAWGIVASIPVANPSIVGRVGLEASPVVWGDRSLF